ncbi:hypothetical protein SAMN05216353_11672 [Halobacillus alkaliphilus]|uniref:Uncharacterized protein n=1 Tax=Halobacillus alkaliphilus TaxID=396056 RepID=A0A1I2N0U5_9BACI|nr:hypothetical protein [Halobacillus alkaliphilus]SFF97382.1 hypothetical protein SAMN05216353_11672 [Halobacillus alkaliphilus]
MGSILVFIISLLLSFRFKKLSFILIVIISVAIGTIYSVVMEDSEIAGVGITLGREQDIIFNSIISLCTIGFIRLGSIVGRKFNKNDGKLRRLFSDNEDLTEEEIKELEKYPSENMFGMAALILGGAGFAFGPQIIIIPLVTLIFGLVTLETFDERRDENRWTSYMGIAFSLMGVVLNIMGYTHILM